MRLDNLANAGVQKKGHSLCLYRLFSSDSQPVSRNNMSKETSLVAGVAIRAASFCIFSSALIS